MKMMMMTMMMMMMLNKYDDDFDMKTNDHVCQKKNEGGWSQFGEWYIGSVEVCKSLMITS